MSWNFPDLYGGIATSDLVPWGKLGAYRPWNFPDLYGGIATSEEGCFGIPTRGWPWNFPDLYGGIATVGDRVRRVSRRVLLGTSLICTVGLRLSVIVFAVCPAGFSLELP